MSTKSNIFFNRERFESVLKWCKQNGVVPEESILRVSQPLKDGNGQLSFDIKNGKRSQFDVVLDRNDLFIPTGCLVALAFEKTDSFGNPLGTAPLYTYPQKANAAVSCGFMTEDAEALYNGLMSIKFGQTVVNGSLPMLNFKHVPSTQPCLTGDGSADCVVPEFDLMDAIYPLAPKYYIQGTEDIKIDINFNGVGGNFKVAAGAAPTTHDTTRTATVYLIMSGVLIKGAADKAKQNPLSI